MKAKRITALLLVAALAVTMTACGSTSSESEEKEEKEAEKEEEKEEKEEEKDEEKEEKEEEKEEKDEEKAEEDEEEGKDKEAEKEEEKAEKEEEKEEETEEKAEEAEEKAEAAADEELYLQAEGQTYVIGTDTTFAPFEFENDEGVHTGIDIELLEAIADEMGFEVDWEILGFSASVAALEAKQVDAVMAGMSITDERMEKYDFSDSYYDCAIGVAVASDADYETVDDLTGLTVVCKTGTTGSEYAEILAEEYDLELLYVEDSSVMYQYVASGQAEACFEDYPIIQYEIARGNIDCKVINTSDYSFPTGLAVLGGNYPELIAAFNEGFNRLKDNGTYDEILAHYFE